jgi:hypothetical protein
MKRIVSFTVGQFLAVFLAMLMVMGPMPATAQTPLPQQPPPVLRPEDPEVAKAREALRQAEAAASLRLAEQKAKEAEEKKLFDVPRLLTVWDRMEKELTPEQMKAFEADEKTLVVSQDIAKGSQDVIDLFTRHFPAAFVTKAEPQYVDPTTLVPVRDANSPQFLKYQEMRKWRTNPVGPRVKDLEDLRAHADDVLYDIDQTPLEKAFPKEQAEKIRSAWKRRTVLALEHTWPWALGIAKIDVLSAAHKMGTYKKDGQYHVEVGMLNKLQGADAKEPVLWLYLSEVSQVAELAYMCRNGFIAELEVAYKFQAEVVEPTCDSVKGEPMKFTSDSQKGSYTAAMKQNDLEIRGHKWVLGEEVVSSQDTSVSVLGSQLASLPATNKLTFSAEAREKGQPEDGKWFPVSCSISLTKELPPPPPPPVVTVPPACDSIVIREDNDRIVTTIHATPLKPSHRLEIQVDGSALSEKDIKHEKNGTYSFNKSLMSGVGTHAVTAAAYDQSGKLLWKCPGDLESNVYTVSEPCAECKATIVGDKKLKGEDSASQTLYLHAEMIGLPEGVKPTISEWRATWPGDKTPTVIAEGADGEVSPSQFPHNAKNAKLVPGPYLLTHVFEYQKKDGTMCRRACSVTVVVDKDGWDKRWLLLLAPLGLLGLLKHKTCPTCGLCPTCSGGPGATPNPIP